MNLLSWNYRGIGNAMTFRELREITLKFAPKVVCIVETQIGRDHAKNLANTLVLIVLMRLVPPVEVVLALF